MTVYCRNPEEKENFEKGNFQLRKNQENSLVTSTMSSDQRF